MNRRVRETSRSRWAAWPRLLLTLLLGLSGVARIAATAPSATALALWGSAGGATTRLDSLSLGLGALELLLAVGLALRIRFVLASWILVVWNCGVAVLSACTPGGWMEYLLLGAGPVARIGWPGGPQLLGWGSLLLAWMAWERRGVRHVGGAAESRATAAVMLFSSVGTVQCGPPAVANTEPLEVIEFEHNDPRCESTADLAALAPILDGVNVVILGETHRDGSAYAAKSRVVRFLHESLGFDVIAWESSILACAALQARLPTLGRAADVGAPPGLEPMWGGTPYMHPLFEYVLRTQSTSRPLVMVGLDCKFRPAELQTSDTNPEAPFSADLGEYLRTELAGTGVDDAEVAAAVRTIDELVRDFDEGTYAMKPGRRDGDRAAIEFLAELARERTDETASRADSGHSAEFLERVLLAARAFEAWAANMSGPAAVATMLDGSFTNPRDQFMADTLAWYCERAYPGRKVIVWTGGFHGLADAQGVRYLETPKGLPGRLDRMRPFAQLVRSRMKDACYVVGTTAVRGTFGSVANPQTLPSNESASLEAELAQIGALSGFVDLRSQPAFGSALRPGHIFGERGSVVSLGRLFDGVLFSRTAFGEMPIASDEVRARQTAADLDAAHVPAVRALLDQALGRLRRDGAELFRPEIGAELEHLLETDPDPASSVWRSADPGSAFAVIDPRNNATRYSLAPVVAVIEREPVLMLFERGSTASSSHAFLRPSVLVSASGSLEGELRFRAESVIEVAGDVRGDVLCEKAVLLSASGALSGRLVLRRGGRVTLGSGLAGNASIEFEGADIGASLELGGFTSGRALVSLHGRATVVLERSDLEPGRHAIGDLDVLVLGTR